jgi:hypothetical protein
MSVCMMAVERTITMVVLLDAYAPSKADNRLAPREQVMTAVSFIEFP